MNPIVLTWIITGISVVGAVVTYVIHYDINTGTFIAQSIADLLAGNGYSVSVVTPPGAPQIFPAPEIDAASGIDAIALLTGVLLLVSEGTRFKHSSKSDE
jgi:hypothetical protein